MPNKRSDLNIASWQSIYDPYFAMQLRNSKQFNRFGMAKTINSKGSNGVVKFKKYPRLATAASGLSEGTTPSATSMTATSVSLTPTQYGSFVELSDLTMEDDINDESKAALDNLADQASRTLNVVTRDALLTTTNVYYANNVASVGAIVTGVSEDDILNIIATFGANNVSYVTDYVEGSTNDNTTPIEPAYIGVCHPHVSKDLKKLSNFILPTNYGGGKSSRLFMEVGSDYQIRFVEDSESKITANAGGSVGSTGLRSTGGSKIDVYDTIIFGKDAYARVKLNKEAVQTFVKPFGSAGTADPLNQRMTVGWKVRHGTIIMYNEKVLRYRSGASA